MDHHNVGERQPRSKYKNLADKMINDQRRKFYSTK
jgi:hypothetical protein